MYTLFFQTLFDVIDANEDGYIQLDEFLYAVLFFMFSSGPDSPLSLMFGPVQEEEKWILVRIIGGGFQCLIETDTVPQN